MLELRVPLAGAVNKATIFVGVLGRGRWQAGLTLTQWIQLQLPALLHPPEKTPDQQRRFHLVGHDGMLLSLHAHRDLSSPIASNSSKARMRQYNGT
jgi:hypothetical protein